MSKETPERSSFSIPPDDPLDLDVIDEVVEQSDYADRSAWIRAAIRGETSIEDV